MASVSGAGLERASGQPSEKGEGTVEADVAARRGPHRIDWGGADAPHAEPGPDVAVRPSWTESPWPARRRSDLATLAVSLAVHLAFAVIFWSLPVPEAGRAPPEEGIVAELVAPPGAEGTGQPEAARPAPPSAEPRPATPDAASPPSASAGRAAGRPDAAATQDTEAPRDGMVKATRLYAAEVLRRPASRSVRMALGAMVPEDRMLQVCGFEGMEQLAHRPGGRAARQLIAHALGEPRFRDHEVEADGGAFAAGGRWWRIAFRCRLSADLTAVEAFEFRVGEAIPRRDWAAHDLGSPDGEAD